MIPWQVYPNIHLLKSYPLTFNLPVLMKRNELIAYLADQIETIEKPHPVRVGIDGPDASGKTVLANDLASTLKIRQEQAIFKREIIRVLLDNFHNPREIRYDRGRLSSDGYYEDTYNYDAVRHAVLDPMGPGGCRFYMDAIFNLRDNMPLPSVFKRAHDEAVLVLDGVFLFRPELEDKFDYKVYLEADPEKILDRAVIRDRGCLGDSRMIADIYNRRYFPAHKRYQREVDPAQKADVVINNNDPENPVIMKGGKL